uniref:polyubiquitin-like n=1 Tax=Semicossyphus pulcher TaxID=241346 RepID=UPI0037E7DC06
MQITIVILGQSHPLTVNPQDTVGSLKRQIQERLGVSSDTQKLVFENEPSTVLSDDSKPLSFYSLQNGCRVSLLVTATFQVFLRNEKGKVNPYDITPEETVNDFKLKVQESEGVAVSQQRLVFQGRDMTSGKLSDYHVKEHSTIDMVMRLRGS